MSQPTFAALLGVSPETYRTWDAGRRPVPEKILAQARALAGHPDDQELLPLPVLATMIRVHVRTLHLAIHLGRLPVVYDTRTTFRRLRPRATRAAALTFRQRHYRKHGRRGQVAPPLSWETIPADYDRQIRAARERLGLSQAKLATAIGAARKAVVYQWESRKRCPSPVFWLRFQRLIASSEQPPQPLVSRGGLVRPNDARDKPGRILCPQVTHPIQHFESRTASKSMAWLELLSPLFRIPTARSDL